VIFFGLLAKLQQELSTTRRPIYLRRWQLIMFQA